MESNIYTKKQSFNMIQKTILIIMTFVLMISSTFAVDQQIVADFDFEENGGSVALDSSGFNNHLIINGASWTTDEVNGEFALDFDGSNDYAQGILTYPQLGTISISSWFKTFSNSRDGLFVVFTDNQQLLFEVELDADAGANNLRLVYEDSSFTEQILNLEADNFNTNQFYHIALSYNFITDEVQYYRNGVLSATYTNIDVRIPNEPVLFRLGTSEVITNNNLNGILDSIKIMNFVVNESQVSELYNSDSITLDIEEVEDNITLEATEIISLYTPNNTTESNIVEFNLNLLQQATCDFYLNNQLTYTFEDIVSVSFTDELIAGDYEYFYYCSKVINETEIFEISQQHYFNVETPQTQIIFQIEGNDFNVNDEELYIATPCPVKGFSAVGVLEGYQSKYNENGILWSKLENGLATINISAEDHEFCLFNGRVIVNELNQTTNYNVQEKEGLLSLGNFSIPNNNYQIYKLNVDLFEIYDIHNPKGHGSTWVAFISALILGGLGLLIMLAGARIDSKVMVLIGGTLLLGAFGLSMGGIVSLVTL